MPSSPVNRILGHAKSLAGPLPGDPPGVPAEAVASAATAVTTGGVAEVSVAFVRPPGTPPALIDAVTGGRLLSLRSATAAVSPVALVADIGATEPTVELTDRQRRALDRLDGGRVSASSLAATTYRGVAEVAQLLEQAGTSVARCGSRWPQAAATLTREPLRVVVPEHLIRTPPEVRVALVDTGLPLLPLAVAAVLVLGYRELRDTKLTPEVVTAARRWHEFVGPQRFVVAVDGIEHRQAVPDENLRIAVWQWTETALGLPLDRSSVVAVSSSWALTAGVSARSSARELRRTFSAATQAGMHRLVGVLAPVWKDVRTVLATAVARRACDIQGPFPPTEFAFGAEDETRAWARLYHTACGPLAAEVRGLSEQIG